MLGFETIGNATVTYFDDKPVLTTDPWLIGNPYFGSWTHSYKIPNEQRRFAEFCYGNMPSCKEGNDFACMQNNERYIKI